MPPATLYLARHASPDWERKDIPYDVPPGPPLTETGQQEARQLGAFLRAAGVRELWVSPMARCQQTARLAAETGAFSLCTEPGLVEWRRGEDWSASGQRVWEVWQRAVAASHLNGPLALVTHGSPVNFLLTELGLPPEELVQYRYDHGNPLPPAGAWEARQDAPGSPWQLGLAFTPE